MGERPKNTIFSYNYHNITHIVKFLTKFSSSLKTKQVFLDVGAGSSPYFELFESKLDSFTVVDMEESLPKVEDRQIIQKIGFAENLPIESESIDVVMSNQVLEHVIDERKAVSESFRVLKKGGYFVGSVPHISPIHLEPYDYRRLTYYGLKKLLEDNGFDVVDIDGNGGVHKAMALSLTMDWFMKTHKEGGPQKFRGLLHLALFPITGFINIWAIVGDFIIGDRKRSPSNYCWIARKK